MTSVSGEIDLTTPEGRFQTKDSNNDGVLSRREWRDEEVAFHLADRNGDGLVTLREYTNLPAVTPAESRFDRADTDGDGVLERGEWRETAEFDRADRNRDGAVTLNEYLNQPPTDLPLGGADAAQDGPLGGSAVVITE